MSVEGPGRGVGDAAAPIVSQAAGAVDKPQNLAEAYASFGPNGRVVQGNLNRAPRTAVSKPPTYAELDVLGKKLDTIDAKFEKQKSGGLVWTLRFAWASLIGDTETQRKMTTERFLSKQTERLTTIQEFRESHAVSGNLLDQIQEAQKMGRAKRLEDGISGVVTAFNQINKDKMEGNMSPATQRYYRQSDVIERMKMVHTGLTEAQHFLKEYRENPQNYTSQQLEQEFSRLESTIQLFDQDSAMRKQCGRLDLQWKQAEGFRKAQLYGSDDIYCP